MLKAVSANLGRRSVAVSWLERVLSRTGGDAVDLVFLQEVPADINSRDFFEALGFRGSIDLSSYQVRSMLLWRHDVVSGEPFSLVTANYHRSYLASAELLLPEVGRVLGVSVHASPTVVEQSYIRHWEETGRDLPQPRPSAIKGELWDADMVLETLRVTAENGPVLAAGDFNECKAWGTANPGNWGHDYFHSVEEAGLVSLTHREGDAEVRTAFTHDHLSYQLDHVLASPVVAKMVPSTPRVDDAWSRAAVVRGELSDHAPIWFELTC